MTSDHGDRGDKSGTGHPEDSGSILEAQCVAPGEQAFAEKISTCKARLWEHILYRNFHYQLVLFICVIKVEA